MKTKNDHDDLDEEEEPPASSSASNSLEVEVAPKLFMQHGVTLLSFVKSTKWQVQTLLFEMTHIHLLVLCEYEYENEDSSECQF